MLKKSRSKSKTNLNISKESLMSGGGGGESPAGSREVLYRNPAYINRSVRAQESR